MNQIIKTLCFTGFCVTVATSCVSTKKFKSMEADLNSKLELSNKQLGECGEELNNGLQKLSACERDLDKLKVQLKGKDERLVSLQSQVEDYKKQRDTQLTQVGDLTVLSQAANENMKQTLVQLESKDKYIRLLQAAKSKADSINLALAVNLKTVLKDGLEDDDVEIKVDKTVVFVNLSDKMLYQSGSSKLTSKADEVLSKIAQIIESRPDFEVMVEGYTDNVPIKNGCISDNWDLSVKRATSVIRVLQSKYNIDPNRLIASGRGEYNALASNETAEGRSKNRRTRIIILPKLNQFYDLLNPSKVPE